LFTVGQESSLDIVESAAAFLFDIFKLVEIVGNKEAVKLRNIFYLQILSKP